MPRFTRTVLAVAYTHLPSDARVIREASEAARLGLEVALLVPTPEDGDTSFRIKGVPINWLPVPSQRGKTTLSGQLRFMRAASRWARSHDRPDVVHVHNMPDYLTWLFIDWQRKGSRVVLDVHDIMSDLASHRFTGRAGGVATGVLAAAERSCWHQADHLITVHEPYAERLRSAGVPASRISVTLNVPDPVVCHAGLRRPPPTHETKLVFHGTVSERTGVVHAVEALPEVAKDIPNVRFYVIGGGDGLEAVREMARRLGVEDRVKLSGGYLPMSEVFETISDAHLAVVPNVFSDFTRHILPVKLFEYAMLGIPSVTTRLPLVERYCADACMIVDRPDPTLLARAIIRVLNDPSAIEQLEYGCRSVSDRHGWARYRDALATALGVRPSVLLPRSTEEPPT